MSREKSLTTKDVAEYCEVTQRTAVQWINEGKLKFFRTPGKHIRVYRGDFIDFLKQYDMPVPAEFESAANGKKKILIVDDDEGVVNSIERILVREGKFDLQVAYDGFEAGQKFTTQKPDLIILDLNMPGSNGYELCAKIRGASGNANVRILAISGVVNDKEIQRIKALGADDFLAKPFASEDLLARLAFLLGWNKRAQDQLGSRDIRKKGQ